MVQLLATDALTLRFALADPAACGPELAPMRSISVVAAPARGHQMFWMGRAALIRLEMTLERILAWSAIDRPRLGLRPAVG